MHQRTEHQRKIIKHLKQSRNYRTLSRASNAAKSANSIKVFRRQLESELESVGESCALGVTILVKLVELAENAAMLRDLSWRQPAFFIDPLKYLISARAASMAGSAVEGDLRVLLRLVLPGTPHDEKVTTLLLKRARNPFSIVSALKDGSISFSLWPVCFKLLNARGVNLDHHSELFDTLRDRAAILSQYKA